MIADMHCDTLSELRNRKKNGSEEGLRRNRLCLDLDRMKAHSYVLQNFAVFVDLAQTEDPFADAMELISLFYEEMEKNSEIAGRAVSWNDITQNRSDGKISAMLTLEEGGMCRGDIGKLRTLYDRGARMMTLCWNYENELACPAFYEPVQPFCAQAQAWKTAADAAPGPRGEQEEKPPPTRSRRESKGLTDKGIEFLEAMEALHMIPDVSHLSDEGVWDVLANTNRPFAASHSNARAVWEHERNLPDDLLRALGERGCVIGLNYYPLFLHEEGSRESACAAIARHARHIAEKAGIESVGLGSDFDGFEAKSDIAGAEDLDNLLWALHRAGFSGRETDLICEENVLNLYREVLA